VAWKEGQTWKGIKTHMGYNQEAFDAECAAMARALETASRNNTTSERITIFTDAQAAIRRMSSDELGPVFSIVQSVRPGPRTGLHKIQAVRPTSGLGLTPSGECSDGTDCGRRRSTAKAPPK